MQIAFNLPQEEKIIGKPSNLMCQLHSLLAKRVYVQSLATILCIGCFFAFLIALFTHNSTLLLGLLTSGFFFALVSWYVLHIWYESEWKNAISSTIVSTPDNSLPSEKQAHFFFEEALKFKTPHESILSLPKWLPFHRKCQNILNQLLLFFFWKKRIDIIEELLLASSSARIDVIKNRPTDPKAHAELANTFVSLSQLFQEAYKDRSRFGMYLYLPFPSYSKEVQWKHKRYAHLAVQELTIVSQFAKDAVWVLEQLAISYKELNMPQDELNAWQKVLAIDPEDVQALVRSGFLAFQLQMPQTGLEAYLRLKTLSPLQADEVLSAYKELLIL